MGWERLFVDHDVEIPEAARCAPGRAAIDLLDLIGTPDAIINFSEAYVPLHAELCERYGLVGPSDMAVRVGRNKLHMREFCAQLGIPGPRFAVATERNLVDAAGLSYPVVIKPAIGCSSTLVERLESHDHLVRRFPEIHAVALTVYGRELLFQEAIREFGDFPFIVEELIDGEVQFCTRLPYQIGEISVESVAYDGRTTILAIHDAPVASNGPFYEKIVNSTPTRIPAPLVQLATNYVTRLHEALGPGAYVLHTEMRTFADGLMPLEFGVRIGGSSLYRSVLHSTGNDFVEILIQLGLGQSPHLSNQPACPTITHYVVPRSSGRITRITGWAKVPTSPFCVDHQLYDDIGDLVRRPPLRSRASGYFALRGDCFDDLEQETIRLLGDIDIEVQALLS